MSLLGLSLAIGILIDDAIVVRENIVRHVEMGERPLHGGARGHRRDRPRGHGDDVLDRRGVRADRRSCAASRGQWFKPFALTIACSVLVSLFVSFSLDPMLSAYWPDPQLEAHERRNPIARALERFNAWFDRQADALQARDRLGARSPLVDGRARRGVVRRRDRAAGRRSAASASCR